MTIETKYNLGDEVYIDICDEIVKCEIIGIRYDIDRYNVWIEYTLIDSHKKEYSRFENDIKEIGEPVEYWHDHCAKIYKLCKEFNEV